MAELTEREFREMFAKTPISRARYSGFLRNVAIAIGNSGQPGLLPAVERLARCADPTVAEAAQWASAALTDTGHA